MKKWISVIAVLALCFTVAACGKSEQKKIPEANGAKVKDNLVLALTSEPDGGFDPIQGYAAYGSPLIQSTLLATDADSTITHDLAADYKLSPDKLTLVFKLRKDAVFTDGKPVTANDVVFTYETAKNSGSTVDLVHMKEVKALDPYTVQFTLERPQSTFLYTAAAIGIVPKHGYSDTYRNAPIGSGPYKLKEWKQGQQAIFERNEEYYGKKGEFKKVTVLFMSEDQAYAAAKAGQVDVAQTSYAFSKEKVPGMALESYRTVDNRGISFVTIPEGSEVNGQKAGNDVTSDLAIRKAINLALDRQAIVDQALDGYGKTAFSNSDHLPWWNEDTVIQQDPKKAKKVLMDAGWKDEDGDGILEKGRLKAKFNLIYNAGDSTRQAISMAVKQQLKEIGIDVSVSGGSWDDIEKKMYSDAVLFGWGNRNPMELYYLYHSSNIGFDYYNTNSYSNKQVDQMLDRALVSGDMEDWKKAQEPLIKDLPWAWLVNVDHLYFVKDGLSLGDQPIHPHSHALDIMSNLKDWHWKQ
ncbi:ABC transporter substrate-binding protein [Bacillus sp. 1P06AnD]|uniref:ABC transporter substrate-binding protein n=1 Tax=Bacillus sp. 1P06AnD TaxID=3132208 RepID=UPI0039A1BAAC